MLSATALLLCWTLLELHRGEALGVGIVYLAATTFMFLGAGDLLLRIAHIDGGGVTWLGLRYVTGFAAVAVVTTLVASAGFGGISFWLAVALAAAGWAVGVREFASRRDGRPPFSLVGAELLVAALVLRVAVAGSDYWRPKGGRSLFMQYPDMLYHLALVKSGIERGLPLRGWVLESGVALPAYHPAFDSFGSILVGSLGLPAEPAFFRLVLPVTFFGMVVGMAVLATSWARSGRAGLLTLGFLGVTFGAVALNRRATQVVGDVGVQALAYFLHNPPAMMAVIGGAACLSVVALTDARRPLGSLVVGGILAGGTLVMKANFAIVLVPAFTVMLGVETIRGMPRRAAAAGLAAVGTIAVVAYPATRGTSAPLALGVGRLGEQLVRIASGERGYRSSSWLFVRAVDPLHRWGAIGDALLTVAYILVVMLGWWLLVVAVCEWRARRVGRSSFARSPHASVTVLIVVVLATLVGLFVSQKGDGYLATWNVPLHTIRNLWWIAVIAAAVSVDAALGASHRLRAWAREVTGRGVVLRMLAAVAVAVLFAASVSGTAAMRQVGRGGGLLIPTDFRMLLEAADEHVPADARILQAYNTEHYNWASALAGRGAVLERANWTREVYPVRTAELEAAITLLYRTSDEDIARQSAAAALADYVVLDLSSREATGLRALGTVVERRGQWVLLRLE